MSPLRGSYSIGRTGNGSLGPLHSLRDGPRGIASLFVPVSFEWEGTVQTRSPLGNLIFFTGLGTLLGLGLGVIAFLFTLPFNGGKEQTPDLHPPDGS